MKNDNDDILNKLRTLAYTKNLGTVEMLGGVSATTVVLDAIAEITKLRECNNSVADALKCSIKELKEASADYSEGSVAVRYYSIFIRALENIAECAGIALNDEDLGLPN